MNKQTQLRHLETLYGDIEEGRATVISYSQETDSLGKCEEVIVIRHHPSVLHQTISTLNNYKSVEYHE